MVLRTCEGCNFSTHSKSAYEGHLKTKKHDDYINNRVGEWGDLTKKYECKYCRKRYSSRSGSWTHEKTCRSAPPSSTPDVVAQIHARLQEINTERLGQPSSQEDPNLDRFLQYLIQLAAPVAAAPVVPPPPPAPVPRQYIYMIQLREFIQSGKPVFKVGKTKQANSTRFRGYPKGSEVILQCETPNCDDTEREIIEAFKEKYIHRTDIGAEYFEGDIREMKRDIHRICD